ncbi:MAG: flagellar motor switch protein FliM [Pseudomonadota bacterium]|jgi:flagellar motor switch protein FliM
MTGVGADPRNIVSQGEMDALLLGLQELETPPPDLPQRWDWTTVPQLVRGPLPGLDAANDALAAYLQPSLCSWLHSDVRVRAEPMRLQTLADVVGTDAGAFYALTLRARPAAPRGSDGPGSDTGELAVLFIETHALHVLTDMQFGGDGMVSTDAPAAPAQARPVPSAVAKQVLRRWGHQVLAALVQAWGDVAPLHWGVDQVAPGLPACLRGNPQARWLVCPFRMEFTAAEGVEGSAGFELALPWVLLEPSAHRWGGRVAGGRSSALARWPGRLRGLLDQVPLAVSAHWSVGALPWRAVAALQVGDWLPLEPQVELTAGAVATLRGRFEVSGPHVAVVVEHTT